MISAHNTQTAGKTLRPIRGQLPEDTEAKSASVTLGGNLTRPWFYKMNF